LFYKFQAEVFWVVTPCSVVVGYQRFGGPRCLHLQGVAIQRNSNIHNRLRYRYLRRRKS